MIRKCGIRAQRHEGRSHFGKKLSYIAANIAVIAVRNVSDGVMVVIVVGCGVIEVAVNQISHRQNCPAK